MSASRRPREVSDTVFGYEHEPVDERPSEFASSSWYQPISGFQPAPVLPRGRARPEPRFGAKSMLAAVLLIVGLGAWALHAFVQMTRGWAARRGRDNAVMCTRYVSPEAAAIERAWHVGRGHPWRGGELFPRAQGVFIRRADTVEPARELVTGQWALVPWFAKTPKLPYATVNARFEELATKPSYKDPWKRGQRCLIPAASFDEPCWETGRNVWWRFRRADGTPWGLAGLWNRWVDRASGEIVESYTMLTINADAHPLLRRMHKPDPKRPPEAQDKRSVVAIEPQDVDAWLHGTPAQAAALVRLTPVEAFDAAPAAR